jgi:hypothetical protein
MGTWLIPFREILRLSERADPRLTRICPRRWLVPFGYNSVRGSLSDPARKKRSTAWRASTTFLRACYGELGLFTLILAHACAAEAAVARFDCQWAVGSRCGVCTTAGNGRYFLWRLFSRQTLADSPPNGLSHVPAHVLHHGVLSQVGNACQTKSNCYLISDGQARL